MRESAARATERLFKGAMVIKGVDGAAELIGAALLSLASGDLVQRVIAHVVSHDLLGPPDGSLSRHFVFGTAEFASEHRMFAIVYLVSRTARSAQARAGCGAAPQMAAGVPGRDRGARALRGL